jgi:hypothetical protein
MLADAVNAAVRSTVEARRIAVVSRRRSCSRVLNASKIRLCIAASRKDFCSFSKNCSYDEKITASDNLIFIRISTPLTTKFFDKFVINYSTILFKTISLFEKVNSDATALCLVS